MTAKPNRKLLPPQFLDAEYQRRDTIAKPEAGTTLLEMQDPAYWANVAKTLKPMDRIEVRPADGTWWAELLVRVVEPQSVRVHVLRTVEFHKPARADASPDVADGYEVKHRGAQRGWCVIREHDAAVLVEKQASHEAAVAWLTGHLRTLAA